MNEETTTADPPNPRPEGPGAGRELRRSRDNRVIAGVAAGLGRYFDIDPVLVRIAFIVLAVVGGSGVLLYLVAWLVMAKEGDEDSAAWRALRGGTDQSRTRGLVAVGLILLAVLVVGGPVLWITDLGFGDGLFLPLLLIAAGLALLLWPEDEIAGQRSRRSSASSSGPEPPDHPPAVSDIPSSALVPMDDRFPAPTTGPTVPVSGSAARADTGDEAGAGELPEPARYPIGTVTVAAMLVATGAAVLLDRLDVIDVRPAGMLATWLVVVGVGLVASAFVGRSVGLIVLGLLILPPLWFATAVDVVWWSGVGEKVVFVSEQADLVDTYRHGVGRLVVDLSRLELDGEEVDVAVGLSVGELVVIVPPDTEVQVDFDAEIGEITVQRPFEASRDDGMDLEIDTVIPGENGVIDLDLDLGIGDGRVEVAA